MGSSASPVAQLSPSGSFDNSLGLPSPSQQAGGASTPSPAAQSSVSPQPTFDPNQIGSQQYDPTKPYVAPQLPQVSNLPSKASALDPNDPQANGATNHAGALAFGLDKLLRGYMQGKAQKQAVGAIQLQKQTTAMQGLYNQQAENYVNLAKSGAPPDQIQKAQDQMNAAWQSYMQFMGQHVEGQDIDKKTGQPKPSKDNLFTRIFNNPDPAAVPAAVYEAYKQVGPPAMHEAQPYLSPQYQAQLQAKRALGVGQLQGQIDTQTIQHQQAGMQQELNTLNAKPEAEKTDDDRQRVDELNVALEKAGSGLARSRDLLSQSILANPNISTEDKIKQLTLLGSRSAGYMFPKPPTVGSEGFALQQYAQDNNVAVKDLTLADTNYIHAIRAWATQHPTTTSSTRLEQGIDPSTGKPGLIPVTVYNTKAIAGAPTPPAGRKFSGGWSEIQAPPGVSPTGKSVTPPNALPQTLSAASFAHQQALGQGNTPPQAAAKAQAAATSVQHSYTGGVKVGQIIPTGQDRKQTADETDTYKKEGEAEINLKSAQRASTALDDQGLVTAWDHAHIGRVTQIEIAQANAIGGLVLKLEGGAAKVVSGKLSPGQHDMFVKAAQDNYDVWNQRANEYRSRQAGQHASTPTPASSSASSTSSSPSSAADPLGIR
jgi:hypothetical protein